MNEHCYTFDKLKLKSGIFDEIVDACYIIHVVGSVRLKKVLEQTYELPLCKNTMICHNKGFKKCRKDLKIQRTPYDLLNCYKYILNDALRQKYKNIIILEDDFIYEDALFNPHYQKNIIEFVKKNKKDDFVFSLGALPTYQSLCITNPYITNLYLSCGMHAILYSEKSIRNIYNQMNTMNDIDEYMSTRYFYKRYGHIVPLITQTFPETENTKSWGSHYSIKYKNKVYEFNLYQIVKYFFYIFNLQNDTRHYKTVSLLSLFLFYLIVFYLIYKIIKIISKKVF
jgi:hypothetical protein